jgi:hypothetical protein
MAQYKHSRYLKQNNHSEYDQKYSPGSQVHNPGIYRCVVCGIEVAAAKGHTLPPGNHHQHAADAAGIEWQLAVFAQQKQAT